MDRFQNWSCAGLASTDASMSVVPAILDERLGLPQVTPASVLETQGGQVRIRQDTDVATEVVGGTMPLVLSVTDQSGEARYPSFKGIMAAKKKPLEAWSLGDLGSYAGQLAPGGLVECGRGDGGPPASYGRRDRQDFGVVGDLHTVLPPLTEEIHKRKG